MVGKEGGQLRSGGELSDLVKHIFPFHEDHIIFAFGYGSGVFSQQLAFTSSNANAKNHEAGMIDLILVIQNAYEFHKANQHFNPDHYATWLRWSGPSVASTMQRHFVMPDAKVLFHVVDTAKELQLDNGNIRNIPPMKYGVVQYGDLLGDLTQWNYFYLAGRMHKPTLPLDLSPTSSIPDELAEGQINNLQAAVATSLLQLWATQDSNSESSNSNEMLVPWKTLYSQIASLSYTGDFRMAIGGEDPHKISKLIESPGQLDRFHDLYRTNDLILQPWETLGLVDLGNDSTSSHNDDGLRWNPSDPLVRRYLWNELPDRFQRASMTTTTPTTMLTSNTNESQQLEISQSEVHEKLTRTLASIVAPAARYQSLKGIFTLGFRKSWNYAAAKLAKGFLRKR